MSLLVYHYNIQINVAQEPLQVRGGTLKVRVDGEVEPMEVRIYGGLVVAECPSSTCPTCTFELTTYK